MTSCLYEGAVRHRRFTPVRHAFRYRLFMVYLDLAELEDVFRDRWLWSLERTNVVSFRRADHFGDPAVPLETSVRRLVSERTGREPQGPIGLLTHLRYFGYCMNPVSFYYCWDRDGSGLESVVAEVHNTPWGETHCYVLDKPDGPGWGRYHHRFRKDFHVSPFMSMEQEYDWRITAPAARLGVCMENHVNGQKIFDATLALRRRPLSERTLSAALLRHPCMTLAVITAIYWQAFRLWAKGVPFHPHPKHRQPATGRA